MPTLAEALHSNRFPNMSGKMAAVVGYILGEVWSKPSIVEMVVTSDGWVLARNTGHLGFDTIIGTAADLERNWSNLLRAAGLTSEEQQEAGKRYRQAVKNCRRKVEEEPKLRPTGDDRHDVP